jgi:hypothetical protein
LVQWNSPKTDKRDEIVKKWSEDNQLSYIPNTTDSSKLSNRNIDLTFSNWPGISGETLEFGSSDHWPLVYKSKYITLETTMKFAVVNWKAYESMLCLLQDFWSELLNNTSTHAWYRDYIRFLGALKNRLTIWFDKEKWTPSLPYDILVKLKMIRCVKKPLLSESIRN